jgi:hypothetical protein
MADILVMGAYLLFVIIANLTVWIILPSAIIYSVYSTFGFIPASMIVIMLLGIILILINA